VVRVKEKAEIFGDLERFETIDEIAIVAVPGKTSNEVRKALVAHCEKTGDRFAILDCNDQLERDGVLVCKSSVQRTRRRSS
jgi:hypothetical protein